MTTITTRDGTNIFFKDWGSKDAQPIVFSHGWPLSADAWDAQMVFFANQGFRTIAHDRRSHGRSDQVWDNNNMDQYADDLAELIEQEEASWRMPRFNLTDDPWYFRRHTIRFRRDHPNCRIGIEDEYDVEHPTEEPA